MNTNLLLYATCLPVRGLGESTICDIERGRIKRIPNLLFDILAYAQNHTISATKAHFEHRYDAGIDEYFQLLVNEEYAFFTDNNHTFPPLDLSWDFPAKITNATIDVAAHTTHDIVPVLFELNQLGCAALQLNWSKSLSELNSILDTLRQSRLQWIEINYLDEQLDLDNPPIDTYNKFLHRHVRVQRFNCRAQAYANVETIANNNPVLQHRLAIQHSLQDADSELTHQVAFNPNIPTFAEAQKHNVAHNRKVYLNAEGYWMNHLSHTNHFGHISTHTISQLLDNPSFQIQWYLNNDQIEGCRTCPYRYVCIDTSEVVNRNGLFYKKDDCGLL